MCGYVRVCACVRAVGGWVVGGPWVGCVFNFSGCLCECGCECVCVCCVKLMRVFQRYCIFV